jgi:hypothetical protein
VRDTSTVHITTRNQGDALVELFDLGDKNYDPNLPARPPRLTNLSARYRVAPGRPLSAGFVVTGIGQTSVLVRAVGPTLASAFAVPDALPDPKVEIYDAAGRKLAENNDWPAGLSGVFAAAGAFFLPAASRDGAVMLTLGAGAYMAVITPADARGGDALLEIYEVPVSEASASSARP